MLEVLLAFIVLVLILAAMSVGVLLGRKPLKGSCGGVGAALGEKDYTCDICGGDPAKCDASEEEESATSKTPRTTDLAYEVTSQSTPDPLSEPSGSHGHTQNTP